MAKNNKNTVCNYFKVVTGDQDGTAEMFLYGYIGQDFWWDEDMNEESITDLAVVRSIRELEKNNSRINIRINSPGGSVMHGDPIISAIRASKAEVHTYVDGIAASMAFDIWLAGSVRHVSLNSKLMCHATSTIEFGTAKQMRQAADRLDKFDESAIEVFHAATGMDKEEIKTQFYDYEDHWMTANNALSLGLVQSIESYTTNTGVSDPEKLSYRELLKRAVGESKEDALPYEPEEDAPEPVDAVELKPESLAEIQAMEEKANIYALEVDYQLYSTPTAWQG